MTITSNMALLTVPFALGLKTLFGVMGAAVAGFPFSIMGVLLMLGHPFFSKLVYGEPKIWSGPEQSGRILETNTAKSGLHSQGLHSQ